MKFLAERMPCGDAIIVIEAIERLGLFVINPHADSIDENRLSCDRGQLLRRDGKRSFKHRAVLDQG